MDSTGLDRAREQLTALRGELRSQLQEMGADPDADAIQGDGFDPGFADSAHATAERGETLLLAEKLRDQLHEVDAALGRVADGSYGTCTSCGQPIPAERLEALPYSALCVNCKQRG